MLQIKINSNIKSLCRIFLGLTFLLLISGNMALAQVKIINLEDTDDSSGAGAYNLYQSYKLKKGKLNSYCYIPYSFDGTPNFGRTTSFYAQPSKKKSFENIRTSLDNSTIIGQIGNKLHVYDTALEKEINSFVVEGLNRYNLSNDGSLVFVESLKGGNNCMKIIDANTGNVIKEIPSISGNFRLSPNDRYLAVNRGESFLVYDLWEGGDPMIYKNEKIKKRKQNTSEFIYDIEITSNGLVAMSYLLKGEIKKKNVRIQYFAVVDIKTGLKLCNIRADGARKSFYSLDPRGQVLFAAGKFYDVKSGKEIAVNYTSKKKEFHEIESWKFHPHIQGVYHALYGKGVNGAYSFE